MESPSRVSVYIDGFNVYYALFKRNRKSCSPRDKWLNYRLLAESLLAPHEILHHVHYFTAVVHRSDIDPEQNLRQETFFRALRTIPALTIHYGKHIPVERTGRLSKPDPASLGLWPAQRVTISTFEEKGTDVNLATSVLEDSHSGKISHAIIISNDTDLIAPLKAARTRIRVSVISPDQSLSGELRKSVDGAGILDHTKLSAFRLPVPVIDRNGAAIYPPLSWQTDDWPRRLDDDESL
ncbi:MAG: NYN domain-containing protein [Thermomicrobiales bacterium]